MLNQLNPRDRMELDSKHLMWLLMDFDINRYLMSNADGRQDGAEKAECHFRLCKTFLAGYFKCEIDSAMSLHYTRFDMLHSATQELTDNLPDEIGFPLKGRPDYDKLAPLFFDKFLDIAYKSLEGSMKFESWSIDELLNNKPNT